MANEKRLIDADALKIAFTAREMADIDMYGGCHIAECFQGHEANEIVDKMPTVDAVEVMRCKDCKQWGRNSGIAESPNGHCFYHCIDTNGHDFCSYGERRIDHD